MLGPESQNNGLAVRRLPPGGQGELGSVPQKRNAVGERHRLDLVVSHVDHGAAEFLMEPLDFNPHVVAKLGIEIAERFIEQEEQRVAHDRAADRDALALTAGKLTWKSFEKLRNAEHFGGTLHTF